MWRPFSSGTEFADWKENNCKQCAKGYDSNWHCDIEYALDYAYVTDGHVPDEIADRMEKEEKEYLWFCPEKEMKEA